MAMTVPEETTEDIMSKLGGGDEIVRADVSAVAVLNRSEVEAQIDAAHRHRRSVGRFLKEAMGLACITREVAESCIYSLPRGGKPITGPSVRLAEIVASAYGNLHIGARVVDVEDANIVAQGVAWDLEKNVRVTLEVKRKITNNSGRRYNEDMITMTGNAAAAIARRNAIFAVVPRAYVNEVYNAARRTAVGDAKTLATRREELLVRLQKIGVPIERVFAKLGKDRVEDIDLDDVETLIGLGTAIRDSSTSIDEAFPPVASAPAPAAEDGKRISIRKKKAEAKSDNGEPEPGSEG